MSTVAAFGKRFLLFLGIAASTFLIAFVLVTVFERKQEAKLAYVRITDVADHEPDAAVWGQNFPAEYSAYMKTARSADLVDYSKYGTYGGPVNIQKLDRDPALRRLFAGYPFSVDYREDRGHMQALEDLQATQRLGDAKPGSCVTCKSAQVPVIMQQIGTEQFYGTPAKQLIEQHNIKYAITCAECHDAKTMALAVNRPAFIVAMQERGTDVTKASRQEMRTYVCAQCHVEYYFSGANKTVVFPWAKGLSVDDMEAYYQELGFADWTHGETGAQMIKMQHPDFELWSSGIHARSGVACADCHMPYVREGATKVTDHWIVSPLTKTSTACLACHRESDEEMRQRVLAIQDRTFGQMQHAEKALLAAIDEIKAAITAGVPEAALAPARDLHRRAQMRWDFIAAESSMGFHSPQEALRVLGDATDLARQAQLAAYQARVSGPQPGGV